MLEHVSAYAKSAPDRLAVATADGSASLTYAQLNARSNQLANHLRAMGLRQGDHVALVLENRLQFFEVTVAAMRSGLYVTPINWHLSADEAEYIANDCGASVIIASAALPELTSRLGLADQPGRRLMIGGASAGVETSAGFEDYDAALAAQPTEPVADEAEGSWMLYSSGTTGKPKGVKPARVGGELGAPSGFVGLVRGLYGFSEGDVYLSPAPLYHAAPAGWTDAVLRLGGTAVVMDRFDPVATLRAIERFKVTHVQFVPTHLIRLLKLPEAERAQFDLSSLRYAVHAAAPCPPDVKRAALEWLGPVVYEYYSGSEGAGFCAIGPEEWLAHPGSVGRSLLGAVHICSEDGTELAAHETGQIWFESASRFEYHGDPAKTAEAFNDRGWSTLGDVGMVDDEGYLYITDRVTNMVISGGVNIYPREIEDVLVGHPGVADVAVVGVADPDFGEAVRAIVEPAAGVTPSAELEQELIAYCIARLSKFKCPRSVVFLPELPRLPTGKLAKRLLPAEAFAVR
ncbi:MAG TPA: AMP-binding protein [Frankiaceae bacterium]|nr:AMP-binding protein [Frankiaceae bacterium]